MDPLQRFGRRSVARQHHCWPSFRRVRTFTFALRRRFGADRPTGMGFAWSSRTGPASPPCLPPSGRGLARCTSSVEFRSKVRWRARMTLARHPPSGKCSRGGEIRSKSWFLAVHQRPRTLGRLPRHPGPRGPPTGLHSKRSFRVHALRDLGATFPGARSPTARRLRRASSLGVSKDAPPPYRVEESTPGVRIAAPCRSFVGFRPRESRLVPSGLGKPLPVPRSALVVSHHLGGLLLPRRRGLVASRSRSWGSPRFPPIQSRFPVMCFLPFGAFPPPTATSEGLPDRISPEGRGLFRGVTSPRPPCVRTRSP